MRDDCTMNMSGGPPSGPGDARPGAAADAASAAGADAAATSMTSMTLSPDPSVAREARAWVTQVLEGWPEDSVDRARLLVSELVTNAVLHARTEITLRVRRDDGRARFEVGDSHRGGPMPKRYVADSPTGRGMRLVASLAEAWGVERRSGGKVVWFSLTRDLPPASPGGTLSLDVVDLGALAAALGEPAVQPRSLGRGGPRGEAGGTGDHPSMVRVRIVRLPLEIYLEAEQHNDAVLRELDLIERSPRRGPQVPPRLLELASELRAFFAAATTSTRAQVEEALRGNLELVDLEMDVPADGWHVLTEMAEQLDEVDQFCREGVLLTLAATPRQRRFRHWYAQQVASQAQGQPPTPWPADEGD